MGHRLTGMTAYQAKFSTASSIFRFSQHGQFGTWINELLLHSAKVADEICVVDPCIPRLSITSLLRPFSRQVFNWLAGRPSIGAWISYGLGTENKELPAFVVTVSQASGNSQALADRQWESGFIPAGYQGVKFRSGADPVLYLSNPRIL